MNFWKHHEKSKLKFDKRIEKELCVALKEEKRNPEIEGEVAKFPHYSVVYAKKVFHGRFQLAEDIIASSPYYLCAYISELELNNIPENIHRIMLSSAIKEEDLDNEKNYWLKQYFKFCDYLDGKGAKPWWLSKDGLNWNYGQNSLNWNTEEKF